MVSTILQVIPLKKQTPLQIKAFSFLLLHPNEGTCKYKKSHMQVQVKKSFYQSFGGINFMEADITAIGFSDIVSQNVGHRSIQAEYSYARTSKFLRCSIILTPILMFRYTVAKFG